VLISVVPGVMGVTDKVATELIQSFGTIDNLLDSIEKVEPVRIRDKYVTMRHFFYS
jgi:5'-3' exonuclease